jgi:hypothetical protein
MAVASWLINYVNVFCGCCSARLRLIVLLFPRANESDRESDDSIDSILVVPAFRAKVS